MFKQKRVVVIIGASYDITIQSLSQLQLHKLSNKMFLCKKTTHYRLSLSNTEAMLSIGHSIRYPSMLSITTELGLNSK